VNRVRRAILNARNDVQRQGEPQLPREYRCGDDRRAIDWHASARAGTIVMRERARDMPLTWSAIVDDSGSMRVGRNRPLIAAATDAREFWRSCAGPGDTWLDLSINSKLFDLRALMQTAVQRLPSRANLLVASDFYELPSLPVKLLNLFGSRFNCTALIARDPWRDALPLQGFVRIGDAEIGKQQVLFIGVKQRARFSAAVAAREERIRQSFRTHGWRVATLDESEGAATVLRAFDLA